MRKLGLTEQDEFELDRQIILRKRARAKYAYALRTGKIQRQPCIKCGREAEGHHPNLIAEPLKVIWLCDEHHKTEHDQTRIVSGKSPVIFCRIPQELFDVFCTRTPGQTMSERVRNAVQHYVNFASVSELVDETGREPVG